MRQYSQCWQGRLGETATRSPTARPETPSPSDRIGAGHLVAEDHRLAHADRAEAAVVVVVQIGAADAAGLDGDLDLSGPGSLRLALLDAQVLGGMNDNGFHGAILR